LALTNNRDNSKRNEKITARRNSAGKPGERRQLQAGPASGASSARTVPSISP
jgi:hypothetical protein